MSMLKLHVSFDIHRKEIRIDFPTPRHAEYYHIRINKHGKMENEKVHIKLPPSVQKMEASTKYEGFIFHFADNMDAARWKDVIWRQVPGSSRQLYIKREWDINELNRALQLLERGDPVVVEVPARAAPSQITGKGTVRALIPM